MTRIALLILILALSATPRSAVVPGPSLPDTRLSEAPPAAADRGTAAVDAPRQPSGGASNLPEVRTRIVAEMVAAVLSRRGDISHMGYYPVPRSYLALPCRKPDNTHCGLLVRLCGPAACKVMRQSDYGPSQRVHPNRIADVHPATFAALCGIPASAGLCEGTWSTVTLALPETSKEEAP